MINKPPIEDIVAQDVDLYQKGRDLWGRCPFHEDHDPSFKISTERQRFHCFGCGASGDVVEYIMRLRGVDFKEACRVLGISDGIFRPNPEEVEKRMLVKVFRDWCRRETNRLLKEWRLFWEITREIRTEEDLELRGWCYHEMAEIEGTLHILQDGTDEEKYALYRREAL